VILNLGAREALTSHSLPNVHAGPWTDMMEGWTRLAAGGMLLAAANAQESGDMCSHLASPGGRRGIEITPFFRRGAGWIFIFGRHNTVEKGRGLPNWEFMKREFIGQSRRIHPST